MHVTISIACYNAVELTKKCFSYLAKNTPREGVEYIITDNASTDGTAKFLFDCSLPHKTIIQYVENHGYQTAHNEALKLATGEFFVVLNNDIFLQSEDWLLRLVEPLIQNEKVGLVGLKNNPGTLKPDGNGSFGDKLEYIDGSCFAARTAQLRMFGLFSPSLEMFFYEDSDLSLRFRQMGFELETVSIPFEHIRSSSVNRVDRNWVTNIRKKNEIVFKRRWGRYLANRNFTNTIFVKAKSDGVGDILAITPVIRSLRYDHPTADITLETSHPDIFEKNPHVNTVVKVLKEPPKLPYDRVIDVMPPFGSGASLNYASYRPICREAEIIVATKTFSYLPELFLSRQELDYGAKVINEAKAMSTGGLVACLSAFTSHTFWEGRGWNINEAKKLIALLRNAGCAVIEVGINGQTTGEADIDLVDKLTLREYFSVIANLQNDISFLVTIDSLSLHVAQAFQVTTYALFGATEPISRVLDFSSVYVVRNDEYKCLGCYQRKGSPSYNKCERGTQGCMIDLEAERVFDLISGKTNPVVSNMKYLEGYARRHHEA